MSSDNQRLVYIADEDEEICKIIRRTLTRSLDVCVTSFTRGDQCLKSIKSKPCDLLVANTSTVGMDGIDLLRAVKNAIPPLPVIIISGAPAVDMAVHAMKLGAFDYCCKPFDRVVFLDTVERALSLAATVCISEVKALSRTERLVLRHMLEGKSTKEIARLRCRSVRTIEDQHYCIMKKLGASNMIDLVKRVAFVQFPELSLD